MGTSVKAPPPRDYYKETAETLQAQIDLKPQQFASEQRFRPQFAELDLSILDQMLTGSKTQRGMTDIYKQVMPALSEADAAGARVRRERDIEDLEELAPRFREAVDKANPENARLMAALNEAALAQVEAGAGLDPSLQRSVSQSARGAQAARGFGFGLSDTAQEALFSGMAGEQLRQSRMASAGQVAGLNAAQRVDPAMAVLGRQGISLNNAAMIAGQAQGLNPGAIFNPESAYAQDVYSSNQNAIAAANIASANAKAGMIGGALGAVGSIGGGMASRGKGFFCWVAREVYGETNPEWLVFRHWMLTEAPAWFQKLYARYGEAFAKWLAPRPRVKALVKAWMDRKVKKYQAEGLINAL